MSDNFLAMLTIINVALVFVNLLVSLINLKIYTELMKDKSMERRAQRSPGPPPAPPMPPD